MKKLLAFTLCLLMLVSSFGCNSGAEFALAHYNGMDYENGYDTNLLYRNKSDFWGGDSGVIWVSEEENAEYGGYFYQYMSGCAGVANTVPSTENGETPALEHNTKGDPAYYGITCITRSKDLNDWEICGAVDNGLGIKIELDEWVQTSLWAPECIYDDETGLYYLYFSAASKINDNSIEGATYSSSGYLYDRFYLGVAVCENPAGPFRLVSSVNFDATTGEFKKDENGDDIHCINPSILLNDELDNYFYTEEFRNQPGFKDAENPIDEDFSAIDINPFFDYDEEGNRTFYLYFVKHVSSGNKDGNQIWGFRMVDMITPDWATITKLCPNYLGLRSVYKGEDDGTEFPNDPDYPRHLNSSWETIYENADGVKKEDLKEVKEEYSVVEGPQMLTTTDKDGRKVYILTYSPRGVGSMDYDVKFAYGYSPLGEFEKPVDNWQGTILGVDWTNNFMSNLGHVQFLNVADEWWIAHWECPEPFTGGVNPGRIYALSSMTWIYDEELGINVPVANGPHVSLQRNPKIYSGYGNIASDATVTATNVVGNTTKFVNDGHIVTMKRWKENLLTVKKSTKITMTFNSPREVTGILIHNSYEYEYAFNSIKSVKFYLSEAPSWRTGSQTVAVINNLGVNEKYFDKQNSYISSASGAVATFNPIMVNKIEIEIDDQLRTNEEHLMINEIEILGK